MRFSGPKIFFFACIIACISIHAQPEEETYKKKADSLKLALKKQNNDTMRCNILDELIANENDPGIWSEYNAQLKSIAKKNLKAFPPSDPLHKIYLQFLAAALNNDGFLYAQKGDK